MFVWWYYALSIKFKECYFLVNFIFISLFTISVDIIQRSVRKKNIWHISNAEIIYCNKTHDMFYPSEIQFEVHSYIAVFVPLYICSWYITYHLYCIKFYSLYISINIHIQLAKNSCLILLLTESKVQIWKCS